MTEPSSAATGGSFESTPPTQGLVVVNHVTWWSLDPNGYHPSILLKVENETGRDLTGERLRFQGRFMNTRIGQVTVCREEVRKPFLPRQRIYVYLHGPDPFELPIATSEWPPIECKVMARIADVGDEGTQTLVVTNVDRVTMTDDDAFQQIERMREFTQASAAEIQSNLPPGKPLTASAGTLKLPKPARDAKPKKDASARTAARLFHDPMPGLGDGFDAFEHRFGLPVDIEKEPPGWTWASYNSLHPKLTVFAGSKGRGGKVDIVILQIPSMEVAGESMAMDAARSLAGQLKTQKLSAPTHSVRYLSTGRRELITARAPGYKILSFLPQPSAHRDNYVIILSRIPGEVEPLLGEHAKRTSMLRWLAAISDM